jgi:hypothetical protein
VRRKAHSIIEVGCGRVGASLSFNEATLQSRIMPQVLMTYHIRNRWAMQGAEMYEEIKEDRRDNKAVGAALGAGLLLNLAILFLWTDTPNDTLALLTGIYPIFSFDDRVLKYPLAMIFIALFCWRTVTLYRKRRISISMQFQCLFLAFILGGVWVFIALALFRSPFIPSIFGS